MDVIDQIQRMLETLVTPEVEAEDVIHQLRALADDLEDGYDLPEAEEVLECLTLVVEK